MYKTNEERNLIDSFKKDFPLSLPMNICINTFNRLEYLKKCIASIVAGTTIPYFLTVIDDGSTDGTVEWLREKQKLIPQMASLHPKVKLGSANSLNYVVASTQSSVVTFANDDMWFHKGWDIACIRIMLEYNDCGAVSFYDYTALKLKQGVSTKLSDSVIKTPVTGLGATMIVKDTFNDVGGFKLRLDKTMGYFATKFCQEMHKLPKTTRNQLYQTLPHMALHMDGVNSKLNERVYSTKSGYEQYRKEHK